MKTTNTITPEWRSCTGKSFWGKRLGNLRTWCDTKTGAITMEQVAELNFFSDEWIKKLQ